MHWLILNSMLKHKFHDNVMMQKRKIFYWRTQFSVKNIIVYLLKSVQNINSRVHSLVWGKGNPLLPVAIYYHIREFIPRSGDKRAIFGYVCKNEPVQEDINPTLNIFNQTHLVYNNQTF